MEELINYFATLEARIAALEEAQQTNEAVIASLEAEVEELKSRPEPEPQIVEKIVEKVVEKPVVVAAPVAKPEPKPAPAQEQVAKPAPAPAPVSKPAPAPAPAAEPASPKAAIYGKAVDDIRLAISLGDRFLYQRELFGQNAELMQRTLTELNELGSFDEALVYITTHFQWDTESSTYQQFLVTLHRRFG
ncbi:MAG: hypothetical protein IKX20_10330 [Paludibacteraceae bacterium]|nr:hypothetical protein [Paludibacteraceae bacterium]